MAYLFLIIAFILNTVANVLLKSASSLGVVGSVFVPYEFIVGNWKLLLGLLFFASNVLFYFLALRTLPLSFAYPIMVAMTFILVNAAAVYFFSEHISFMQVLGYITIVVGVILVVSTSVRL